MPRHLPQDSLASPRFSGPSTFACLPLVGGVDLAIIGVPFDTGATDRAGSRFGPG